MVKNFIFTLFFCIGKILLGQESNKIAIYEGNQSYKKQNFDDTENGSLSPAFYFAKNYAKQSKSHGYRTRYEEPVSSINCGTVPDMEKQCRLSECYTSLGNTHGRKNNY